MAQKINTAFIVPFIEAVHSTFEMMMGRKVTRKDVYIKKNYVMFGDVSGVIGVSGISAGTTAISFPASLAIRTVEDILGEKVTGGIGDVMVHDGVGEIINMIAGQAKTTLATTPMKFDITLPTIISGRGHELYHKQDTQCTSIIFATDDDQEFSLDLCIRAN